MTSDIQSQASGFFSFLTLGSAIGNIVNALIIIAALASLIYLVLGGLSWITSGGDKAKTETAQKQITNAIIGLIIVFAAFAIFNLVTQFLGLDKAITIN